MQLNPGLNLGRVREGQGRPAAGLAPVFLSHPEPGGDGVGPYSHLCHGLGQVGRDGRQPLAAAVHNAIAASAHGWAGAGGQAAELGMS